MTRIVHGRTVITNYPLGNLRNEEKRDWDLKVRGLRINEIPIDIKADFPGGDYPIQAILRLRGLYETMKFLAKGLGPEVEYQVDPDPRTGIIAEQLAAAEINPAGTLLLHSGDSPPDVIVCLDKTQGKVLLDDERRTITDPYRVLESRSVCHAPHDVSTERERGRDKNPFARDYHSEVMSRHSFQPQAARWCT